MTVQELIRELQAMPNQAVPVMVMIDLSDTEDLVPVTTWAPVEIVRHEGSFVQLEVR